MSSEPKDMSDSFEEQIKAAREYLDGGGTVAEFFGDEEPDPFDEAVQKAALSGEQEPLDFLQIAKDRAVEIGGYNMLSGQNKLTLTRIAVEIAKVERLDKLIEILGEALNV